MVTEISEFTKIVLTDADVSGWSFSSLPNGYTSSCNNGYSIFGGYDRFVKKSNISKTFSKSNPHCIFFLFLSLYSIYLIGTHNLFYWFLRWRKLLFLYRWYSSIKFILQS